MHVLKQFNSIVVKSYVAISFNLVKSKADQKLILLEKPSLHVYGKHTLCHYACIYTSIHFLLLHTLVEKEQLYV